MNYHQHYLDLSDEGPWLIKIGDQRYRAGYDKATAENLVARLNKAHRPNIQQAGDELWVCWGDHEKHESCHYTREI